jgi:glycosyltransferase involved in cell wall biosynthesis
VKVVVISQALAPQYGGAAFSEANLCANLQRRCTTVVLCQKGRVDTDFLRGFGLTDVKEVKPRDGLAIWRDSSHWLARCLSDADILHVNGHWRWEHLSIALWCQKRGIATVIHPRGMFWIGHRKIRLKKLFNALLGYRVVKGASRVIALSHFEMRQWGPYGIDRSRTVVIPNGVSGGAAPSSKRPHANSYFLYLGRIETRKNLGFLIEAFARYVRDGGLADLLLVGPVERGYDVELKKIAASESIVSRVIFKEAAYGSLKSDFFKHAVAVPYPAIEEPFGRVPFETLAAGGIPVVPVESGAAEYLQRFLPTCLYPIADKDALVACLRDIERDPKELERGLEEAQRWVKKELDWIAITERVLDVYRNRNESPLPELSSVGRVGEQPAAPVL